MKKIVLNAGVRYFEDGIVNGTNDIAFELQQQGIKPLVPCAVSVNNKFRWCPEIDPESGVVLNWADGVSADVHYKVCDDCEFSVFDDDKLILDFSGYCPDFLCPNGNGFGDYIVFQIDEYGTITNWNKNLFNEWLERRSEN